MPSVKRKAAAPRETVCGLPVLEPEKLQRWLEILFASYRTPLAPDAAAGYTIALADLTAHELEVAFTEALRRHNSNFPPAPAQVRGLFDAALERMPRRASTAKDGCPDCKGTGFRLVADPRSEGGKFAVSCQCRTRKESVK